MVRHVLPVPLAKASGNLKKPLFGLKKPLLGPPLSSGYAFIVPGLYVGMEYTFPDRDPVPITA